MPILFPYFFCFIKNNTFNKNIGFQLTILLNCNILLISIRFRQFYVWACHTQLLSKVY